VSPNDPSVVVNFFFNGSLELTLPDFTIVNDLNAVALGKDIFSVAEDVVVDLTYEDSDLELGNPPDTILFIERIVNKSGITWTDYHIDLDGPNSGVFIAANGDDGDVPSFSTLTGLTGSTVAIDLPSSILTVNGDNSVTVDSAFGVVTLSSDRKSLTFVFDTPITSAADPGNPQAENYFDIFIPFTVTPGLAPDVIGSVSLTQRASYVPEPLSAMVWSVLIGLGISASMRRRGELQDCA
jgi:hypothetical protein